MNRQLKAAVPLGAYLLIGPWEAKDRMKSLLNYSETASESAEALDT